MNFYVYNEDKELGEETLGTSGKFIIRETIRGAIARAKASGFRTFRLYSFTNFYDNSTFKLIHRQVENYAADPNYKVIVPDSMIRE